MIEPGLAGSSPVKPLVLLVLTDKNYGLLISVKGCTVMMAHETLLAPMQ